MLIISADSRIAENQTAFDLRSCAFVHVGEVIALLRGIVVVAAAAVAVAVFLRCLRPEDEAIQKQHNETDNIFKTKPYGARGG